MTCQWCRSAVAPRSARRDLKFCSRKCRQAAWRMRGYAGGRDASALEERPVTEGLSDTSSAAAVARTRCVNASRTPGTPLRFAYADPPYPGTSSKYYRQEPTFAGEVDHRELIGRLTDLYDGWALSTSAKSLRWILPMCPEEARLCAWVKPHGVPPATLGLHNVWEPIIVVQGRRLRPGLPDALVGLPARHGGTLMGRKPLRFCAWLFHAMGMLPGDSLDDLFPGTGIVGRAWETLSVTGGPDRHVQQWLVFPDEEVATT